MSMQRESDEVGRRTFLKGVAAGAVGLGLAGSLARDLLADERSATAARVKRRMMGRTGREVSVIGVGGGGINPQNSGLLKAAYDNGIDFIDVASGYGRGQAELGVGAFLQSFPDREKLFINTKGTGLKHDLSGTGKQVYDTIKAELQGCLQRMKTDYVDLFMWPHGAQDLAFLKNEAARDALRKLKEEGLVKHLGTSSHKNYKAVGEAIVDDGFYDVVLIVINICTQNAALAGQPQAGGGRRGRAIEDTTTFLKKAQEKNIGVMAMKTANPGFMTPAADGLLASAFPGDSGLSRHQRLYTYGMHQAGVSNVIVGMRTALHLREAIQIGAA